MEGKHHEEGVIIVAGGSGSRMGAAVPKQFLPVAGREMLVRTVELFAGCMPKAAIVAVVPEPYMELWESLAERYGLRGLCATAAGGANRTQSVRNGLAALPPCNLIAVHDGARPLASPELIRRCFDAARSEGSAVPAVQPADSFRMDCGGDLRPVDRKFLRAVQTPQVFRGDIIRDAYARMSGVFTDDSVLVESAGRRIAFCEGEPGNIKITVEADLRYAEFVFREIDAAKAGGNRKP